MILTEVAVRNKMKEIAKEHKVKATIGGFYAKCGNYFWAIQNTPYSFHSRYVHSGIKPWSWDETLDAIVHPNNPSHFTDLSRWGGGSAMKLYFFAPEVVRFDAELDGKNTIIREGELDRITREIFESEKAKIDNLIQVVATQYEDFDEYCIANADYTSWRFCGRLYAGFAAIRKGRYAQAMEFLLRAKGEVETREYTTRFCFCYGRYDRDLRDVLIDYCKTMIEGSEWTDEKIVGKREVIG